MANEIADTTVVAVGDRLEVGVEFVEDLDLEAGVEERHHLEALEQRLGAEFDAFLEDHRDPARNEPWCRYEALPSSPSGRVADDLEFLVRRATVLERHRVAIAVAVDLDLDPFRQGVDDRDTDAVKAAGHLVATVAELAAGVEHGEHHFGRGHVLVLRVLVDRDATAVVADLRPHRRHGP